MGRAGLQADIQTLHQHGVRSMAVASLITVQNDQGVVEVHRLAADLVLAQISSAVAAGIEGVKTGALGGADVVDAVSKGLEGVQVPIVVDPVFAPTRGLRFSDADAIASFVDRLLPLATVFTPNAAEAGLILGTEIRNVAEAKEAAIALLRLGPSSVLLKGGHLSEEKEAVDLFADAAGVHALVGPRLGEFRGTGCALASSIAARLAKGDSISVACRGAKDWLYGAMKSGAAHDLEPGLLDHFHSVGPDSSP